MNDKLSDNLYFLNFKYIHGNLSGEYGTPIFGFGYEFDKEFL
jgi:hypothetical protein